MSAYEWVSVSVAVSVSVTGVVQDSLPSFLSFNFKCLKTRQCNRKNLIKEIVALNALTSFSFSSFFIYIYVRTYIYIYISFISLIFLLLPLLMMMMSWGSKNFGMPRKM